MNNNADATVPGQDGGFFGSLTNNLINLAKAATPIVQATTGSTKASTPNTFVAQGQPAGTVATGFAGLSVKTLALIGGGILVFVVGLVLILRRK
jgi:hypothetical protein